MQIMLFLGGKGDVENTFYVTGKRFVEADVLIPNTWMDVTDTTTEIDEELE